MQETITLVKKRTTVVAATVRRTTTRVLGLDALRGLAILGMVFSGVFPHEEPWPAWMFHAQVGPPDFLYDPATPGITWVDLVFPFFIFTMGAAFPLALTKRLNTDKRAAVLDMLTRGALLVFFAIVLRHTNPGFLKAGLLVNYLTGVVVFMAFFLVFMRFNLPKSSIYQLRIAGFSLIFLVISLHNVFTPLNFDLYQQDIIILVLANMAVFGALIWVLSKNNLMLRLGILAFFAGIWLTKDYSGSYAQTIFKFHPNLSWFYQFAFLKYLNIIIPGTILGDLLIRRKNDSYKKKLTADKMYLVLIGIGLLFANLYGLFSRDLLFTFIADLLLCSFGVLIVSKYNQGKELLLKKAFYWGVFWLFLGLAFEPMDGGIKKDPSSFSFWFLTSGLAFFTYIICEIIAVYKPDNIAWKSIIHAGQNPMVAYVAGSFVILPLLYFTRISAVFDYLRESNIYLGIIKSIVVTLGVVWLTSFTTRRKWFWKT